MHRSRITMSAVIGIGAAFAITPAVAAASTADEDSAVGDVITIPFRPVGAVFDARSGPAGEGPSGSVTWFDRSAVALGPVTCLTVTGNRARIGFENQGTFSEIDKGGFLLVEDNGTPGAGRDNLTAELVPDPPSSCPPNEVVYTAFESVTSGELAVHDAAATPTSKDECKNGGWRNYGVFSNQHDCVRFVRHQARQECIFIRAAIGRPAFRAQYGSGIHKRHAMRRCVRQRMND